MHQTRNPEAPSSAFTADTPWPTTSLRTKRFSTPRTEEVKLSYCLKVTPTTPHPRREVAQPIYGLWLTHWRDQCWLAPLAHAQPLRAPRRRNSYLPTKLDR